MATAQDPTRYDSELGLSGADYGVIERRNELLNGAQDPSASPATSSPRVVVAAPPPLETQLAAPKSAVAPDEPALAVKVPPGALFVGPGVTIKGEIIGCDMLRVEGKVEGNTASERLVVCAGGGFEGTAQVTDANIEGRFEGTLDVAGRLLLRPEGRASGSISYAELEIERGGKLLGDVSVHGENQEVPVPLSAPAPAAVRLAAAQPPVQDNQARKHSLFK